MIYLILLFVTLNVFASTHKTSHHDVISTITKSINSGLFRIDECEKKKIDWMNILLMKSTVTLNYSYKLGCDLQGTIMPKVLQWFPANINLRNMGNYNKIKTNNMVTLKLEQRPVVNLEIKDGLLSGNKSNIKFSADYRVRLNLTKEASISEHLGGEVRITEIDGKKVSIKEKIKIATPKSK